MYHLLGVQRIGIQRLTILVLTTVALASSQTCIVNEIINNNSYVTDVMLISPERPIESYALQDWPLSESPIVINKRGNTRSVLQFENQVLNVLSFLDSATIAVPVTQLFVFVQLSYPKLKKKQLYDFLKINDKFLFLLSSDLQSVLMMPEIQTSIQSALEGTKDGKYILEMLLFQCEETVVFPNRMQAEFVPHLFQLWNHVMNWEDMEERDELMRTHPQFPVYVSSRLSMDNNYQDLFQFTSNCIPAHAEVLGSKHKSTLSLQQAKGHGLRWLGRFVEAEDILLDVLEGRKETLGHEHYDTLVSKTSLASLWMIRGHRIGAVKLYEQVAKSFDKKFGPNGKQTLRAKNNLYASLMDLGRLEEALKVAEEVMVGQEETLGRHHIETLTTLQNMASLMAKLGQYEQSKAVLQVVILALTRNVGAEARETLITRQSLASVFIELNQIDNAKHILEDVVHKSRRILGMHDQDTVRAQQLLSILNHQDNLLQFDYL